MAGTTRNPRTFQKIYNAINIFIGSACVLIFLSFLILTENRMRGFPLMFILAGIENMLTAYLRVRGSHMEKGRRMQGIVFFLLGIFFFFAGIVAGVCIWT